MPKPTFISATAEHEIFYNDILASARKYKLNDREFVAILALIVGRMCGVAAVNGTESDRATLVDTAKYNLQFGREHAADLLAALGKGH